MRDINKTYETLADIRENVDTIEIFTTGKNTSQETEEEISQYINKTIVLLRKLRKKKLKGRPVYITKRHNEILIKIDKRSRYFCRINNITLEQIKDKYKGGELIIMRQALEYYLHIEVDFSSYLVGKYLDFTHAAIIHNCNVVKNQYDRYIKYLEKL